MIILYLKTFHRYNYIVMKILYYHCFAGISGDMNLAAMFDLGVPAEHLLAELKKLNLRGYTIDISAKLKMGISGTQVKVILIQQENHSLGHSLLLQHQDHDHRSFSDIKRLIEKSSLSEEIKTTSIRIFEKLAIAEGKIHNKPIDQVHFHEVGAIDSIVDIVGAAICYHYLKPDKVLCSTIELGGGFVNCAHGKFPIPAPATIELLKNIPVKLGTVQVETTTPTGAAILASLVDEFTDEPKFSISKTAYGIGHRDMQIPNVLRVHLAEKNETFNLEQTTAKILECNIDDMPAEHFEFLIDRLMSEGAQDVFLTPIIMKKSRPATKISVLCNQDREDKLTEVILKESSTLGVRSSEVTKNMLRRELKQVKTKYGNIDVKIALFNDEAIKSKPEYEQCKEAALRFKIPIAKVIQEVQNKLKEAKE
jgi:pyridinium-3,5-bisthiocarboxylic acid mononucleotide nickel chelatase